MSLVLAALVAAALIGVAKGTGDWVCIGLGALVGVLLVLLTLHLTHLDGIGAITP